jgi:hypothetical protein
VVAGGGGMTKDEALDLALQAAASVQENTMIYKTFEQWKSGNVMEDGVPRTEYYSEDQLDLVEMGWSYGYDAGRAVEQALDKKAENARELGLDYEPVQEPVAYLCENAVGHKYFRWKKPSSEFKPIALYTTPLAAQRQWVGLTDEEMDEFVNRFARYELARATENLLRSKNT